MAKSTRMFMRRALDNVFGHQGSRTPPLSPGGRRHYLGALRRGVLVGQLLAEKYDSTSLDLSDSGSSTNREERRSSLSSIDRIR